MAWSLVPDRSALPVAFGAVGGALGALAAVGVGALLAAAGGRPPVSVPNAVGAWAVRWLQTAAPQALDNFYLDATVGGLAVALLLGTLGGAVFHELADRSTDVSSVAWGLGAGIGLWVVGNWGLVPALDPALGRVLGPVPLVLVCLAYGVSLGLWHAAGRHMMRYAGWWPVSP